MGRDSINNNLYSLINNSNIAQEINVDIDKIGYYMFVLYLSLYKPVHLTCIAYCRCLLLLVICVYLGGL